MSAEESIRHFTTESIPSEMRFDYWLSLLRQSLWPVTDWTDMPQDFNVELQEASFGCLTSMQEIISPHRSRRTRRDLRTTEERCYLLFANQAAWDVAHNSRAEHFAGGDCVLVDSEGDLETSAPLGFNGVILKLPVGWMRTWLANPDSLVGGRIAGDSRWGRVLAPIVRQLTPQLVAAPPLPHGVLVDQLGAMLALIAGEIESSPMPDLSRRIQRRVRERCCEPQLTASDIAASLNIPPETLHRTLGANGLTFAQVLLDARVGIAQQILASPSSMPVSSIEVARRAGFANASHLERALRKRKGQTSRRES